MALHWQGLYATLGCCTVHTLCATLHLRIVHKPGLQSSATQQGVLAEHLLWLCAQIQRDQTCPHRPTAIADMQMAVIRLLPELVRQNPKVGVLCSSICSLCCPQTAYLIVSGNEPLMPLQWTRLAFGGP